MFWNPFQQLHYSYYSSKEIVSFFQITVCIRFKKKTIGHFRKPSNRLGKLLGDGYPSGCAPFSRVTGNTSAAEARDVTERMATLSIADRNMPLRRYEQRQKSKRGLSSMRYVHIQHREYFHPSHPRNYRKRLDECDHLRSLSIFLALIMCLNKAQSKRSNV